MHKKSGWVGPDKGRQHFHKMEKEGVGEGGAKRIRKIGLYYIIKN